MKSCPPTRRTRLASSAAALLGATALLALAGCSTDAEIASPEVGAEAWLQAQMDGDLEKIAELTLGAGWVAGAEWDLDSVIPETRVSGITDAEVLGFEVDDYGPEAFVQVRWKVEGGDTVESTLTMLEVGDGYLVVAPEGAVPDIRPAALPVESWVDPDSEHLDPAFVPECGETGVMGAYRWCREPSGADAKHYPVLPFGTYEYTARSNAIGVEGSPEVRVVLSQFDDQDEAVDGDVSTEDDPQVTLSGNLFDMRPEFVERIDAAFAELIAECPVVGPEEMGRCAHPGADGQTRLDAASWKAFNGGVTLKIHVSGTTKGTSEPTRLVYHYSGDEGVESLLAVDQDYPAPEQQNADG